MIKPTDQGEEKIMSLLQSGLQQSDPVPPDVADFAKAALSWRTIDAELAKLSYDSSEESATTGVRGLAAARILAFESEEWTIDLEFNPFDGHLMGQIEPAGEMTIELHVIGRVLVTQSDDQGRFGFEGIYNGPVAIVTRIGGEQVVKTEWIVL
jgi:hypothetical protein